ncbi:MAG TPA: GntR family transcriptional regulator, partial [Alphaproteobacteria bacterium]|nr:GntR family transcriptional regulator [Alphaproteobacteria bacterium]
LADPSRRALLDALKVRDGRTLGELEQVLPDLTRFGVMKHVKVLEEAQLIASRKVGREKFHYLNPVPIQLLSDRWIARFAKPVVRAMADLKTQVEASQMQVPNQVYEILIKASPEAVWRALTSPEMTPAFNFGARVEGDWRAGGKLTYWTPEGTVMWDGDILECQPPHRLVTTFRANWQADFADDRPSKCTYEIVQAMPGVSKLTVVHEDFDGPTATYKSVAQGWMVILSGLKTLLETGKPMSDGRPAQ